MRSIFRVSGLCAILIGSAASDVTPAQAQEKSSIQSRFADVNSLA
jgi:hypothetical protein